MTVTIVTVPKWGLAMEEGRITAWHIKEGEDVRAGADLVDIETSKIANTLEAPADGVLLRILVTGDAMQPCGTAIAVIAPGEASDAEIEEALSSHRLAAAEAGVAGPGVAAAMSRDIIVAADGADASLRMFEAGEGGTPAIFLHGFGGDARTWSLLQAEVASGRRTIALDLPGHGGSAKHLPDWSAAAIARLVGAVIGVLGIARCHIIGHSMGAVIARELAAQQPALVASFTAFAPADIGMLDPAYVGAFRSAKRRTQMADALAMLFADPAFVTRDMAEDLLRYRRIDGVDAALAAMDEAILAGAGKSDSAAAALWSGLGRRALAIWGAEDRIVAPPPRGALADACGWAVIDRAGHMPFVEQPVQAAALIMDHLMENEQ